MEYSGTLLAISVDSVAENNQVATRYQIDFPILSDLRRDVVWEYGLLHKGAGPRGSDVALPAMVLIDCNGLIVWQYVSKRVQDRPSADAILKVVQTLVS